MTVGGLERVFKEYFLGGQGQVDLSQFYANLERDIDSCLAVDDELTRLRGEFILYRCDISTEESIRRSILDKLTNVLESENISTFVLIELASIAVTMEEEQIATDCITRCCQALQFQYQLTGCMAMKSRHQTEPCAVLMTRVDSFLPCTTSGSILCDINKQLDDDDLFDEPQLVENQESIIPLGSLECALLLVEAMFVDKFETRDDASAEKIDALVRFVLKCTNSRLVQRHALYLRSLNEANRPKFMNRSMRQLEALLDGELLIEERSLWFCLPLVDIYSLTRDVALSIARHGNHLRAAEMFTRLGMMSRAAVCFVNGGQREKAVKLLESNLDSLDPTSQCLLGDLVVNEEYYKRAFTLSKNTFFPALRALGLSRFRQADYETASTHFHTLTVQNPSCIDNWFLLGCCQMYNQKWTEAIASLTRVIAADHDHSQAWNNMAAIHLHLQNYAAAQHALRMSVRLDYDSWRIWENLFRVSLRLGDVGECVWSCQRLLELRGKEAGFAPFLALVERLEDAVGIEESIKRSIDCLVSWMDNMFSDDTDYLWIKSEYLRILRDDDRRLQCCITRHQLLLSGNDYEAIEENLNTIKSLSTHDYDQLVPELKRHKSK